VEDGRVEPGEFGELVRYCAQVALTQEELGDPAGLSARAIDSMERGRRPQAESGTARRVADALGLSAADRTLFQKRTLATARRPGAPRLARR
jgi:hypothetical protein